MILIILILHQLSEYRIFMSTHCIIPFAPGTFCLIFPYLFPFSQLILDICNSILKTLFLPEDVKDDTINTLLHEHLHIVLKILYCLTICVFLILLYFTYILHYMLYR